MTARSPRDNNTPKPDAGSIGLIILVVLAGLASIVMLVSGSSAALKLALVAALWAAVLGFFLVVRYRRQAQESVTKLELQERAHKAELDAAAAQADSSTYQDRDHSDSDILEEIRSELSSIRAQIEELTGRDLSYEPAALHAEARRILELEAQAKAASEREFSQDSYGAPSEDAISGRLGTTPPPAEANPLSDIISEKMRQHQSAPEPESEPEPEPESVAEPEVEPVAEPELEPEEVAESAPEPEVEPVAESTPEPVAESTPEPVAESTPEPEPEPAAAPAFDTNSFQSVRWGTAESDTTKQFTTEEVPAHESRHWNAESQKTVQESEPRGRRRSDQRRDGAVTVAELLAEMKKKDK